MTTRPKKKKEEGRTQGHEAIAGQEDRGEKGEGEKSEDAREKARAPAQGRPEGRKSREAHRAAANELFGASGRRPKAAPSRGPARGRVTGRRRTVKPAAAAPRVPGVAIKGALGARYTEVLTPAALRFLAELHREFEGAARAHAGGTRRAAGALRRRRPAGLSLRHARDPRRRGLARRADPGRFARPPRRDHRTGRSQDDHQRAQFRRQRLHGGLRGCQFADLGQQHRRPDQSEGSLGRQDRLHRSRHAQALPALRQAGSADRAPARLASRRGASDRRRRADFRRAVRFRALFLSQRAARRSRPAPALISICRSSRRARKRGCGTTCSCSRRSGSAFRTARSGRRC